MERGEEEDDRRKQRICIKESKKKIKRNKNEKR
jgi:hypothetical protein